MRNGRRRLMTGLFLGMLIAAPREAAAYWDWIHELSGPTLLGLGYNCRIIDPRPFRPLRARASLIEYVLTTRTPHGFNEGDRVVFKDHGASLLIPSPTQGGTPTTQSIRLNGTFPVRVLSENTFAVELVVSPLADQGANSILREKDNEPLELAQIRVEAFALPSVSFDQCIQGTESKRDAIDRAYFWFRYQGYFYFSIKHEADPEEFPVYAWTQGLLFEFSPSHPGTPGRTVVFYGIGAEYFRFFSLNDRFDSFGNLALKLRPFALRFNPPPGEKMLGAKALEAGLDVRWFRRAFTAADFGVGEPVARRGGGEWSVGLFLSVVLR